MKHYRRTTSCWLISQALCFCLLLQGTGIADALPLLPKQLLVSKSELEATRLKPALAASTPSRSGPLERFAGGVRSSAEKAWMRPSIW